MPAPIPIVLVPGLNCSARLYAEQIPALWRFGPVQVADHTRADSMDAIAADILAHAPPRFALAGLSMGGYIALTMLRLAPARVSRLALLDTSARPETPEQSERRKRRSRSRKAAASTKFRRCSFQSSFIATVRTTRRSERVCGRWPMKLVRRLSCASRRPS
jgi:pimeloyl-ACP methyl ester carboxylesterase